MTVVKGGFSDQLMRVSAVGQGNGRSGDALESVRVPVVERRDALVAVNMLRAVAKRGRCGAADPMRVLLGGRRARGKRMRMHVAPPKQLLQFMFVTLIRLHCQHSFA